METANILAKILVAVIIGDDTAAQQHGRAHVETHENVGHINIPKALASRAHHRPAARQELAVFLEEAAALHEQGVRIIFVTGYPKTKQDAHDLNAACPNLITFSLEDTPGKAYGSNDPRSVLPPKNIYVVDASRGHGRRQRYMENCMNTLLVGLQIHYAAANLTRSKGTLQEVMA